MDDKKKDAFLAFGLIVFFAFSMYLAYELGCRVTAFRYQIELGLVNDYIRQLEKEIKQQKSVWSPVTENVSKVEGETWYKYVLNVTIPKLFNASHVRYRVTIDYYGYTSDDVFGFDDAPNRVPYNWSIILIRRDPPCKLIMDCIYYVKVDDVYVKVGESRIIKEYPYMEGEPYEF